MRLEQEPLQFAVFRLETTSSGGFVHRSGQPPLPLSSLGTSYLDVLTKVKTIEQLVQFYLGQGWLVSFHELYHLIDLLVRAHLILNPSFQNEFKDDKSESANLGTGHSFQQYESYASADASSLPFFRSLKPELAQFLLQKAERHQVPAQRVITKTGELNRDLFILLKGSAALYKSLPPQRRRVAQLEAGAIFGERGFLLNQPRSADIITETEVELLRIRHLPEFDQLINVQKASDLQQRFLALQALNSSSIFKDLPSYSLDHLLFSGKILKASAHQILMREGQPGNSCYILLQGNVVVSQGGKNISVLQQGQAFGEISLLISGGKRTATILTQQECLLLEIQQNDFYRVLSQNLFLAKEIEKLAHQRLHRDQKSSVTN